MRRRLVTAVAALTVLGCAGAQHPRSEAATLVCVRNDTEHPVTVEVRDADSRDELGQIHVTGFTSAERWIRTGSGSGPIMVSIDAVGMVGRWVPPAFERILVGPDVPLALTVGTDGITPFAHSSVDGACPRAGAEGDPDSASATADSASADSVAGANSA